MSLRQSLSYVFLLSFATLTLVSCAGHAEPKNYAVGIWISVNADQSVDWKLIQIARYHGDSKVRKPEDFQGADGKIYSVRSSTEGTGTIENVGLQKEIEKSEVHPSHAEATIVIDEDATYGQMMQLAESCQKLGIGEFRFAYRESVRADSSERSPEQYFSGVGYRSFQLKVPEDPNADDYDDRLSNKYVGKAVSQDAKIHITSNPDGDIEEVKMISHQLAIEGSEEDFFKGTPDEVLAEIRDIEFFGIYAKFDPSLKMEHVFKVLEELENREGDPPQLDL